MPYIVTTTTPQPGLVPGEAIPVRTPPLVSRRAVATLDEAREYASQQVVQASYRADDFADAKWGFFEQAAFDIGTAIGAIGPLPDGTVIEVEQTHIGRLWDGLDAETQRRLYGWTPGRPRRVGTPTHLGADDTRIIDAYNAAQTR